MMLQNLVVEGIVGDEKEVLKHGGVFGTTLPVVLRPLGPSLVLERL